MRDFIRGGLEPDLADILNEPITGMIMVRDSVTRQDLLDLIAKTRSRLRQRALRERQR